MDPEGVPEGALVATLSCRWRTLVDRWYSWAVRSRLTPVKNVAAMIKRHLPNVLTYFKHRIYPVTHPKAG